MKKFIKEWWYLSLVAIMSLVMLVSAICQRNMNKNADKNTMLTEFEYQEFKADGVFFYVVEIKGHEYICNGHGGIIHSESCGCKKPKTKAD